jgi:mannose-6-phosphate isomerase-like protein (cupin superfamily)
MKVKVVKKLWGREIWHHNDARYSMKTLVLHVGAQSSLHYHINKRETFLVVHGWVLLEYPQGTFKCLREGFDHSVTIEPGASHAHRFMAISPVAHVIEVSNEHDDNDVVRIEDARTTDLIQMQMGL